MNFITTPAATPARSASRFGLMTLALLVTLSLAGLRAETDSATPPMFADAGHVLNGCYLSATAYLARFSAEFPGERGAPVAISPKGFGGKHTIALVTWRGEWFGRDEYFGVFALGRSVAAHPTASALARRAEMVLSTFAVTEVRAGRAEYAPTAPAVLSAAERAELIRRAADALPLASEVFWVRGHGEPLAFLFFRPAAGVIAVYDPLHGTATSETTLTDGATVVGLVATNLGYPVAAVSADATFTAGALVAANR